MRIAERGWGFARPAAGAADEGSRRATRSPAHELASSPPVLVTSWLEILAPPEIVWDVLTDLGRWPNWNPAVTSVSPGQRLVEGSVVRWKRGPASITSRVQRVEPSRLIARGGGRLGVRTRREWRLERRGSNTIVRAASSLDGFLARIVRSPLRRIVKKRLDEELWHLKLEAERQAS